MIKNIEHAKEVQARRASSGKRGYAKAIRRYLHQNNLHYRKSEFIVNWKKMQHE